MTWRKGLPSGMASGTLAMAPYRVGGDEDAENEYAAWAGEATPAGALSFIGPATAAPAAGIAVRPAIAAPTAAPTAGIAVRPAIAAPTAGPIAAPIAAPTVRPLTAGPTTRPLMVGATVGATLPVEDVGVQSDALVDQALSDIRAQLKQLVPIRADCEYVRRVQDAQGTWLCPDGTFDTGRSWGDEHGDKQCMVRCLAGPPGIPSQILAPSTSPPPVVTTGEPPTQSPTERPTQRPTRRPTQRPTQRPRPTERPTQRPRQTERPTQRPRQTERPTTSRPSGSGTWQKATATYYTSYPECCDDKTADQTECRDYSGCKYQGQFAAFSEKKSKSWVQKNDIVAFYQAPNSKNRKEWGSKWKNKRLRIRNPKNGKTMEVAVVDTCDDGDCGGCCSKNANRNGGYLVDLEWHTAKRFYDTNNPPGMQTIEWQTA